jgi:4-amino-4-deoxy-L-arabinose transferase-like glycosyltransferase
MTNSMGLDSQPGATAAPAVKGLPRWHRVVLAALVAIAGALYAWNLGDSGLMSFYATAAKSMSESWRAFFFGTFDPGASITLDKLAGFVIPQALSARLFGFSQVSVTLPQVIEGMVTVMAGYRVVRQWAGALAGLAAAAALAFTPLLVSMFGHSMEDGMLVMFCVLAVMSWQDGIRTGKLRWLLVAGVWVGLGFQAKMMEAWLIVPALGIAYLLTAPHQLAKRIRHVLMFGVMTLAVSLSWMTAIQLVPADSRPYVDGSTNNNMYSMVFGYNGFNRFIPDLVPGAVKDMMAQPRGGAPGDAGEAGRPGTERGGGFGTANDAQPGQGYFGAPPAGAPPGGASTGAPPAGGFGGGASDSPSKLVSTTYTSQIGWLYPLALAGAVLGFAGMRRRTLDRNLRAGVWASTLWLGVAAVVMSVMHIPHTAYLAILAFPLAALSAVALTLAAKDYRSADAGWRRLILPTLLGLQTVWAVVVAATTGLLEPWLPLAIAATALLAVGALASKSSRRIPSLPVPAVAGLAGVSLLLGPALWSGSVLVPGYAGSAMDAYAGPRANNGFGALAAAGAPAGAPVGRPGMGNDMPERLPGRKGRGQAMDNVGPGGAAGGFGEGSTTLDASDEALLHLTQMNVEAGAPPFATDSWNTASKFIMAAGADVLPFGGFSGSSPSLTLDQFTSMVTSGQLKFVLLSESLDTSETQTPQGFMRAASYPDVNAIREWMSQHFQLVPPLQYAGNSASSANAYLYQYKG